MDKLRPPFRAQWYDLLLLFFLVFCIIFITVIVVIVVIILSNVRVPLLLLALAPLASPSSVGACAPLGIEYSSVRAW